MKNYSDFGIYDFSDYAEELIGEALIRVNGGSCGGGFSGGGAGGGTGGGSGTTGAGSSGGTSSGTGTSSGGNRGGSSGGTSGGSSSGSGSCGGGGSSSGSNPAGGHSGTPGTGNTGSQTTGTTGTTSSGSSCGGSSGGTSGSTTSGKTNSGTSGYSSGYGYCGGGQQNDSKSGNWGQLSNESAVNSKMQDYKKDSTTDDEMHGEGNSYSRQGCKMQGASKLVTETTGKNVTIRDINSTYDSNKDGLLTREEITYAIQKNLPDGKKVTSDYFEKTLNKATLDSISRDSNTYVLGRAENVHGGQHWIVLEGYSTNAAGQVQFNYNGTSVNDAGRNYILGEPTTEQKNNNYYRISKIETYKIQ